MNTERDSIHEAIEADTSEKTYTIFIDETGDLGLEPLDYPILALGAVITDKPEMFAEISKWKRIRYNLEEVKYYDLPDGDARNSAEMDVAAIGTRLVGVYIDKRAGDNPKWWFKRNKRSTVFQDMFNELTFDIMIETMNNLIVIVDEHTALNNPPGEEIFMRFAENKNIIHISRENSEDSRFKDIMQSGDIAIGAMGNVIVRGSMSRITMKIRRLRDEEE